MIIKKAVYKKVRVTENKLVTDEVYGCDYCKKEILQYPNEDDRLELRIFQRDKVINLHFCSWDWC
jgi:hypothetical protein